MIVLTNTIRNDLIAVPTSLKCLYLHLSSIFNSIVTNQYLQTFMIMI